MPDCFVLCFCIHLCVRFRHPKDNIAWFWKNVWHRDCPFQIWHFKWSSVPRGLHPDSVTSHFKTATESCRHMNEKSPLITVILLILSAVHVSVCLCVHALVWVLFTLGMLSHATWSRAFTESPQPPHPPCSHPPLNTKSYWRKRVVTSLRHAGVSACGSGGQRGL